MLTVSYLLSHNLTSLITGALGHRLSLYPVVTPCALSSYLRCDPAVLLHEHPASGQASQYFMATHAASSVPQRASSRVSAPSKPSRTAIAVRVIMLYTSVLLRVLVGKGYGVRASEYGLAPTTIQVRNIRTDTHSIP